MVLPYRTSSFYGEFILSLPIGSGSTVSSKLFWVYLSTQPNCESCLALQLLVVYELEKCGK